MGKQNQAQIPSYQKPCPQAHPQNSNRNMNTRLNINKQFKKSYLKEDRFGGQ